MLKKILKIKNFGSFKEFNADNNLAEFKKYNLIWGLNGTGKTTLSNFFICLNNGKIDDNFFDKNSYKEDFDILLDNEQHIKEFKENSYCNRIKVFNRDFVSNNLTLDNNNAQTTALTYTIGETAKEIKDQISELNQKLSSYYIEIQGKKKLIAQNDYDEINTELDNLYKDTAELVRRDLHIQNTPEYNIRHFKHDYFKYCENKSTITEDEKNEYAKQYIQPVKNKIPPINFEIITNDKLLKLENLLNKKFKRANIKEELVQWLEKGLDLKTENVCPFCNQQLMNWEQRYNDIQKIVTKDDSFLEFEKTLDELLNGLKSDYDNIKNRSFSLRTEDFCIKMLQENLNNYSIAFDKYKSFLENTINTLVLKKSAPDNIFSLENKEVIENFTGIRDNLNSLILKHNEGIDNFHTIKSNAKEIVIGFYVQQCKADVIERLNKLNLLTAEIKRAEAETKTIEIKIKNLNAELTNQKAPMSEIERYIYIVFGHKKYTLNYNEDSKSYSIYRESGEIAKNLSEGEKTVIAFAYFLATLKTHNFDLKNSIVVIDDPVSSLDQQYLYNLINLIAHIFDKSKAFEQLFVLTHNFYFYKKMRDIFKYKTSEKEGNLYELFQINRDGTSYIKNADKYLRNFTSEYTHTIKYLKEVMQMEDEKIKEIPLGNSIRKVLEIFLAFRCPKTSGIYQRYNGVTKDIPIDEKCKFKYLQDIANASSHTEECEDLEALEEFKLFVTKKEIEQLFNFIKLVDEPHYNEIIKL